MQAVETSESNNDIRLKFRFFSNYLREFPGASLPTLTVLMRTHMVSCDIPKEFLCDLLEYSPKTDIGCMKCNI